MPQRKRHRRHLRKRRRGRGFRRARPDQLYEGDGPRAGLPEHDAGALIAGALAVGVVTVIDALSDEEAEREASIEGEKPAQDAEFDAVDEIIEDEALIDEADTAELIEGLPDSESDADHDS